MDRIKNDRFRLGMIGCGSISHIHADAIAEESANVGFVSCSSRNEKRASEWAAKYKCESYYTDFVEMCKRENLDGVLLATWPKQHYEQIIKIIDAGVKNILCEKALTMTGKEAEDLSEYASEHGVFLMEGFMYKHNPAIRKIDELLSGNAATIVDNVRAVFSNFDDESTPAEDPGLNWRQNPECGGGVVFDMVCYCVNAISHFCGGNPTQVFAIGSISGKYAVENRLFGLIQYDNGRVGIIESSKRSISSQELQISCSNCIINLPVAWTIQQQSEIKYITEREWAKVSYDTYAVASENSYRLQLFNFIRAARGIELPLVPLADSVKNTHIIEALVKSLHENKVIQINISQLNSKKLKSQ